MGKHLKHSELKVNLLSKMRLLSVVCFVANQFLQIQRKCLLSLLVVLGFSLKVLSDRDVSRSLLPEEVFP